MYKNAFMWSALDVFSSKGIQLLSTIILARILGPADFGLVAIILIIVTVIQVFIDGGFSVAITRNPDVTEKELSTVFMLNIAVSIVFAIFLYIGSNQLSIFFEANEIVEPLKVLSLVLVISSIGIVPRALLTVKLEFKILAIISFFSAFISSICSIYLALKGFGYWSLVFQFGMSSLIASILPFFFCNWLPKGIFCKESARKLFLFSYNMLLAGLLDVLFKNIPSVFIGKIYSLNDLGLYNQADRLASLPLMNLLGVIQRVNFQLLANNQKVKLKYNSLVEVVFIKNFMIFVPFCALISLISEELIYILLGESWERSSSILAVLIWAYLFIAIGSIFLNSIKVLGLPKLYLKLEIYKKVIILVSLLLLYDYGIIYIAYSLVIANALGFFVNLYCYCKVTCFDFKRVLRPVFYISFSTIIFYLISLSIIFNNVFLNSVFKVSFFCVCITLFFRLFLYDWIKLILSTMKNDVN